MSLPDGIVDLHAHWLSERAVELLAARSQPPRIVDGGSGPVLELAPGGPLSGAFPLGDAWLDVDARLRHLHAHGIGHQLISWPTTIGVDAVLGPQETVPIWAAYNEDLGALVRAHPQQFSGVAVLSTSDIEWSARELRRAHAELGLIGAVLPIGAVSSVQAAQHFAPVFAVAQELGSHLYFHTGPANPQVNGQPPHAGHADTAPIRRVIDTAAHVAQGVVTLAFTDVLDEYPDVTVQIAALGGSGLIGLVAEQVRLAAGRLGQFDVARRFRRISLDTGPAGSGSEAIGLATRVFGASQVVFGSDYGPSASVAPVIEHVAAAPITDDDRRQISSENALRILGAHARADPA